MMKKIILIFLLIGNISFSQTKQETIDFLNQKLSEYTDSWFGVYSISTHKVEEIEFLVIRAKGLFNNPDKVQLYFVDPKDINSIFTTSEFRTDGKLGIKILCNEHLYSSDGSYEPKKNEPIRIYCTPAPDETIIRIKKGIIHLVSLMGKTINEPKELFKD